ncbi:STAS domain-containing protein [Streptomyces sp. NPDC057638]|uniref:STAS domain-containing protein n=1 Tax=Streptomyces sp. NPDC057638 TaxID=3346190 RepID=UPI00368CFAA3
MTVPPQMWHSTALVTDPATGDRTMVVDLVGEADMGATGQLDGLFLLCLCARPQKILVDLTRLVLIDSAGLGALTSAALHARTAGVPVVLAGHPPPLVRRFLSLTATPLGPLHPAGTPAPAGRSRRPGLRWWVGATVPWTMTLLAAIVLACLCTGAVRLRE